VELPRLQQIWEKYGDEGLSIVAVQSDKDLENGRRLIEKNGLTFHILHNEAENDVVNGVYLSEGNPTTYIIDRDGRILSYHLGFQEGDEVELEEEITALFTSSGGCR
jgi:cytochrome c biogenesis protein CcmG/thiol:disulfide interchange protein DsbE